MPAGTATPTANSRLLANVDDAREMLGGISRTTFYSLISSGRTPRPVRVGGRQFFNVTELRDWIDAGCPAREAWEAMKAEA
jgi:predicted DNA-binding transcriptional regulator AlpA